MRQRTARRCYLRRLLGGFRHSGLRWGEAAARATLRVAIIHMRQHTAPRCYLRRLALRATPAAAEDKF